MKRYLALDVGGNKIETGLVAETGRVVKTNRVPSREPCSLQELLSDIDAALTPLKGLVGYDGLGVGFPALGDYRRGVLDGDRSLFPCVSGFPLRDHLVERYSLPVRMTTDANLFALGVARFGEGRGHCNVLALTLGTGVGVGVILDGALYEGSRGIPDEVLRVLQEDDRPLFAAGHHFERLYGATGVTLSSLAAKGEVGGRAAFQSVGRNLAEAIRTITPVLPALDVIIIGGGVARSWRFLAPALREGLQGLVFPVFRTRLKHPALLGGAALFAESL